MQSGHSAWMTTFYNQGVRNVDTDSWVTSFVLKTYLSNKMLIHFWSCFQVLNNSNPNLRTIKVTSHWLKPSILPVWVIFTEWGLVLVKAHIEPWIRWPHLVPFVSTKNQTTEAAIYTITFRVIPNWSINFSCNI